MNKMDILKSFKMIANNPGSYANEFKKKSGKPVIGYFCSYTIEEIILAAGALPFRIFGTIENISLANSHLQSYCCSLVRCGLEDALSKKLNFLDGTVFPHTCDSIQRLSDIWRLNAGYPVHLDIVLPVKLNSQTARDYMTEIIHKFTKELQTKLNVEITDQNLKDAIKIYNKFRTHLSTLYTIKKINPGIIKGSQVYDIIKSSMIMEKNEFNKLIGSLIEKLEKEKNKNEEKLAANKRIVLTGGVCSHPDIYSIIEKIGGVVVGDDLCTGSRYFDGQISENESPIEAISKRYFERSICPTKHMGTTTRGKHVVELAKSHDADGVIFLLLKFCDPHSFDYPYIKKYLAEENIPCMLIEIEDSLPPEGQLKTRFESFVEMI
jgi:bzd-type benzoyl-CoA reductase N subunit